MKDVTLTVWMKHASGVRWRKDSTTTGTIADATAKVAKLYALYVSTDIRCEIHWSS